ncbi:MAG: hypothetical protein ABI614_06825 [Planctomycetota bacterium]
MGETNLALHRFLLGVVGPAKYRDSTLGRGLAHCLEEMFVIVWFGSQDEVHLEALQQSDVIRKPILSIGTPVEVPVGRSVVPTE